MIKRKYLLFILVFILILLAGCYGGEGASSTDSNNDQKDSTSSKTDDKPSEKTDDKSNDSSGGTLHMIANGELPTLKTNGQMDGLSSTILSNIFEGLYRLDQNSEITEGMAESYEVTDDGLVYTFYLRDNAVWSNGEPVTAHDFIYGWKRSLHPDTFSPHAYNMDPVHNAAAIQDPDSDLFGKVDELGVKAIDDYTLEVTLDYAVPYLLDLLTSAWSFPQNQEFVESQGENYALEPEYLISNGPFIMESWNHDQSWVLKKNDTYWDSESVKLDKVEYKVAKETATQVNLYETNAIDVVSLSSEFVDVFADDPEYDTSILAEMYFMRFNQDSKYLGNVNIRKAIDMVWDKEQAAELILKNGSKPIYYLIRENSATSPSGEDFRNKFGDLNKGTVEEAQELFAKGLEEIGENEISIELLSYDDDQRKSVAEFIKNQLENNLSGLKITINQQPNKQKLALEDKQDYDISHSGWRSDLDPVQYLEVFLSDGPYNWQSFKHDEYDRLIKKAQTDFTDNEQRFADMQEAERILIDEEAVISPMYQAGAARLVKPHVKELIVHPANTYTFKWTYLEK